VPTRQQCSRDGLALLWRGVLPYDDDHSGSTLWDSALAAGNRVWGR
jgi:hypothetical protein